MKIIKSLIGRRQFILAACATSTGSFFHKKLLRPFSLSNDPDTVLASETPISAFKRKTYSDKYSHLLSPIKIGKVVLKNRMMQADSYPFFMQDPETFPSEPEKIYFINHTWIGCQVCKAFCPVEAIRFGDTGNEINQEKCIRCGTCYRECPISVISETKVWN